MFLASFVKQGLYNHICIQFCEELSLICQSWFHICILQAVTCSEKLMTKLVAQNRRTLDILAARCYFYHSRAYELTNKLDKIRGYVGKITMC